MNEWKEIEPVFDYCFNEFLKMADFIKGDLEVDPKLFLEFILQVFREKIKNLEKFQREFSEKYKFTNKNEEREEGNEKLSNSRGAY